MISLDVSLEVWSRVAARWIFVFIIWVLDRSAFNTETVWFSGVYEGNNYRPTWSDRASYLVFLAASVQVLVWSMIVLIKHHSASLLSCVTLSSCLLFTNELKCSIYETFILRIKCYWLWMHTVLLCLPVLHLYNVNFCGQCVHVSHLCWPGITHTHIHTRAHRGSSVCLPGLPCVLWVFSVCPLHLFQAFARMHLILLCRMYTVHIYLNSLVCEWQTVFFWRVMTSLILLYSGFFDIVVYNYKV